MAMASGYSYSYYPKWDEGVSFNTFSQLLLDDYLKEYRNRIFG